MPVKGLGGKERGWLGASHTSMPDSFSLFLSSHMRLTHTHTHTHTLSLPLSHLDVVCGHHAAAQHLQQGGLAAAGGAEHESGLALREGKGGEKGREGCQGEEEGRKRSQRGGLQWEPQPFHTTFPTYFPRLPMAC
jgi:hypothetical protein